jgi:hypothetical protein
MSIKGRNNINISALACSVALTLGSPIASAIIINTELNADLLAEALIIPASNITVTSSTLTGGFATEVFEGEEGVGFESNELFTINSSPQPPTGQAGIYTNVSGVYGLPSEGGIVLSSGFVEDYQDGPNNESLNSGGFNGVASDEQNQILSELTGQPFHSDPVQLDITFDVNEDVETISFIAAFGSEEYPQFVNSSFTDAFGMFLNGELVSGVLPSNPVDGQLLLPVNIDHPDFAAVEGTELNGLLAPNGSPLLRFDIPVEPGSVGNTFSIMIADTSDSSGDSTVFLSSFGNFDSENGKSEFTPILPDPSNPTNEEGAFVFELPELEENETIWIDPDVATGYVYLTDGVFGSVTAPTLLTVNDSDGFMLHWVDIFGAQSELLMAGQTYNFSEDVSEFTLDGIDPLLGLNPTDNTAFTLGVSFKDIGTFVTQNPIVTFVPDTTSVPEPSSIALFGLTIFGLLSIRRKKN